MINCNREITAVSILGVNTCGNVCTKFRTLAATEISRERCVRVTHFPTEGQRLLCVLLKLSPSVVFQRIGMNLTHGKLLRAVII
jgi:hypothetical protein